jgi:hypothetical protein
MADYIPAAGWGGGGTLDDIYKATNPSTSNNTILPPANSSMYQLSDYLTSVKKAASFLNSSSNTPIDQNASAPSGLLAFAGDGDGDGKGNKQGPTLWDMATTYNPFMFHMPDAAALSVAGTLMGIDGYNGTVNMGYIGKTPGIWFSGGVNVGVPEMSLSGGLMMANYSGAGDPTFESFMGNSTSSSFGFSALSLTKSNATDNNGSRIWTSYQLNIGLSSRELLPIPTYNYSPFNYTFGFKFPYTLK